MDWQNSPARLRLYIAAVIATAIPAYVWSIVSLSRSALSWQQWLSLAGVTLVACTTSRLVVRIPRTQTWMAMADTLIIAVTMIYGVAPGVLANGVFHLASYWSATRNQPMKQRRETLRWRSDQALFNLAAQGLAAYLYGSVYYAALPEGRIAAHLVLLPVLLLAGTAFIVNSGLMHGAAAITGRGRFFSLWRQNIPIVPLYFLASASAAAVIYFFHQVGGPWAFLLALPILIMVYYAHKFYDEKYEEISDRYIQAVEAFATTIEALEYDTEYEGNHAAHLRRIQTATLLLARALGVDQRTYEALEIASFLHDVGKISIPSYILQKPSRFTEREMQKMRIHAEVGAQILSRFNFQPPVVEIVKHHHENWDGSGYPDRLKGEEIPYGSRILAVADMYGGLRERRRWRDSHDRKAALAIMHQESHRFDPRVFGRFLEIVPYLDGELERLQIPQCLVPPKEHLDRGLLPDTNRPAQTPPFGSDISAPQREVFALFEILQTIGNSLSRADTLTILAAQVEKIIPFDTLVIFLMDEHRGALSAAHVAGRAKEAFQGLVIEVNTRLAGWVAANNRMLQNVHPGPDVMELPEEVRIHYQNSILAPLSVEERPIGTIALYAGSQRFSDDHVRLMEIIANRASVALNNAIRFEEAQEDAFTDRLTGLANSRFLYIFIDQALQEAKRYREQFTVIEMDLDDFKSVNDRYGHHSGDRFLKGVGSILKSQMRESDVLVRYAGDEFIAILPKTTLEQARLFSYRLQDAVEAATIDVGVGKLLTVGISLGLASYPNDGSDLESLLMAADKNMYEHKSRRKGRRAKAEELEPGVYQPSLFGTEEIAGPRPG